MFPAKAWKCTTWSRFVSTNNAPDPECLMLIIRLSHFLCNTHKLDYTKLYQNFLRSMPNVHNHGVTRRMIFHTLRPVQRKPSMLNKRSRPLPKTPSPKKQRWSYTTISPTKYKSSLGTANQNRMTVLVEQNSIVTVVVWGLVLRRCILWKRCNSLL